jgi:hypothetical protein
MDETVKIWFQNLYSEEISEVQGAISNERIWEKGYDGKEPNPHTNNLKILYEYLQMLEDKLAELNK